MGGSRPVLLIFRWDALSLKHQKQVICKEEYVCKLSGAAAAAGIIAGGLMIPLAKRSPPTRDLAIPLTFELLLKIKTGPKGPLRVLLLTTTFRFPKQRS